MAALGASVLTSRSAQAAAQATHTATSREELKAIDTSTTTAAYLAEPGREGWFVWQTGNFRSQLAADGFEGIYIEADAVSIASGCWVRVLEQPGTYHIDWFGARAAADILPIWNKASAIAAGGTLRFGAGTYVTSGTLSYRAASNTPLNICGVSMTRTIIRNTGSGFTFQYYGGQGANNQVNGGGVCDLKIEKAGSIPCSGIDLANVSFGQVHHTDTSKVEEVQASLPGV